VAVPEDSGGRGSGPRARPRPATAGQAGRALSRRTKHGSACREARRAVDAREHPPPDGGVLHPAAGSGHPRRAGRIRHVGPSRLVPSRRLQRGPHPRDHPGDLSLPGAGGNRRAGLPRDRHARALGVCGRERARGAGGPRGRCDARRRGRIHPDPGDLPRDPDPQPRANEPPRRRDRRDALAQPARGRRLQVQPAERGPRRYPRHRLDSRTGRTRCSPTGSRR
jgi:hypothetical protein